MSIRSARQERELDTLSDLVKRQTFEDTDPINVGNAIRVECTTDGVEGVLLMEPAVANPLVSVVVKAVSVADGGTITVKDRAGNAGGSGEIVSAVQLTADDDYAVLFSDGVEWHVLASDLT